MIYVVTNKATGAEVSRYAAAAPVAGGFPFAEYNHTEHPDGEQPPAHQSLGQVSKLVYMGRFTDAELAAIYGAAKVSLAVEVWLDKFKLAEFIDLSDPRTLDGLHAIEAAGLIGPGRALEILNGQ